jgi:hypothetical protein
MLVLDSLTGRGESVGVAILVGAIVGGGVDVRMGADDGCVMVGVDVGAIVGGGDGCAGVHPQRKKVNSVTVATFNLRVSLFGFIIPTE